jgi:DNA helicase II / ATP-dependent DNA helicase PcrA
MNLTPDQLEAVRHNGHTLLTACPGSGKTRAILAKLLRCVDNVRDTPRRIGCITYTNAAVDEIEHRLSIYGRANDLDHFEITTIHTFCLQNILACFYNRIPSYRTGYKVLSSDSERYHELVAEVCRDHGLTQKGKEKLLDGVNRESDGSAAVGWPLTKEAVADFWSRQEAEGLMDFSSIVYHSFTLTRDHSNIAQWLSRKFAWLLVDEFQDTSPLQVELLKLIADVGHTKFLLVGDPYQSIFSFNGARPSLMPEFAAYINARTDIVLSSNWRSSSHIIAQAHRLLPRDPVMTAVGECKDFCVVPSCQHGARAFEAVVDYFLPTLEEYGIALGQAAILASTWYPLRPLGQLLREYGVPVVGPGASPYRRSRVFGPLAEAICGYLTNAHPKTFTRIERQLINVLSNLPGAPPEIASAHHRRITVCRLIQAGSELNRTIASGSEWLHSAAETFSTILVDEGVLLQSHRSILSESVAEMHDDMRRNNVDIPNLSVADLGMLACPEKNLKLLTIHSSKGREFDAVAIIDLHDGKFPSKWSRTEDDWEENRRLLYVAVTRAQRLLMYVTNEGPYKPSPYIATLLAN